MDICKALLTAELFRSSLYVTGPWKRKVLRQWRDAI